MAKKKKDQYAEGQYGLIGAMDQYQQAMTSAHLYLDSFDQALYNKTEQYINNNLKDRKVISGKRPVTNSGHEFKETFKDKDAAQKSRQKMQEVKKSFERLKTNPPAHFNDFDGYMMLAEKLLDTESGDYGRAMSENGNLSFMIHQFQNGPRINQIIPINESIKNLKDYKPGTNIKQDGPLVPLNNFFKDTAKLLDLEYQKQKITDNYDSQKEKDYLAALSGVYSDLIQNHQKFDSLVGPDGKSVYDPFLMQPLDTMTAKNKLDTLSNRNVQKNIENIKGQYAAINNGWNMFELEMCGQISEQAFMAERSRDYFAVQLDPKRYARIEKNLQDTVNDAKKNYENAKRELLAEKEKLKQLGNASQEEMQAQFLAITEKTRTLDEKQELLDRALKNLDSSRSQRAFLREKYERYTRLAKELRTFDSKVKKTKVTCEYDKNLIKEEFMAILDKNLADPTLDNNESYKTLKRSTKDDMQKAKEYTNRAMQLDIKAEAIDPEIANKVMPKDMYDNVNYMSMTHTKFSPLIALNDLVFVRTGKNIYSEMTDYIDKKLSTRDLIVDDIGEKNGNAKNYYSVMPNGPGYYSFDYVLDENIFGKSTKEDQKLMNDASKEAMDIARSTFSQFLEKETGTSADFRRLFSIYPYLGDGTKGSLTKALCEQPYLNNIYTQMNGSVPHIYIKNKNPEDSHKWLQENNAEELLIRYFESAKDLFAAEYAKQYMEKTGWSEKKEKIYLAKFTEAAKKSIDSFKKLSALPYDVQQDNTFLGNEISQITGVTTSTSMRDASPVNPGLEWAVKGIENGWSSEYLNAVMVGGYIEGDIDQVKRRLVAGIEIEKANKNDNPKTQKEIDAENTRRTNLERDLKTLQELNEWEEKEFKPFKERILNRKMNSPVDTLKSITEIRDFYNKQKDKPLFNDFKWSSLTKVHNDFVWSTSSKAGTVFSNSRAAMDYMLPTLSNRCKKEIETAKQKGVDLSKVTKPDVKFTYEENKRVMDSYLDALRSGENFVENTKKMLVRDFLKAKLTNGMCKEANPEFFDKTHRDYAVYQKKLNGYLEQYSDRLLEICNGDTNNQLADILEHGNFNNVFAEMKDRPVADAAKARMDAFVTGKLVRNEKDKSLSQAMEQMKNSHAAWGSSNGLYDEILGNLKDLVKMRAELSKELFSKYNTDLVIKKDNDGNINYTAPKDVKIEDINKLQKYIDKHREINKQMDKYLSSKHTIIRNNGGNPDDPKDAEKLGRNGEKRYHAMMDAKKALINNYDAAIEFGNQGPTDAERELIKKPGYRIQTKEYINEREPDIGDYIIDQNSRATFDSVRDINDATKFNKQAYETAVNDYNTKKEAAYKDFIAKEKEHLMSFAKYNVLDEFKNNLNELDTMVKEEEHKRWLLAEDLKKCERAEIRLKGLAVDGDAYNKRMEQIKERKDANQKAMEESTVRSDFLNKVKEKFIEQKKNIYKDNINKQYDPLIVPLKQKFEEVTEKYNEAGEQAAWTGADVDPELRENYETLKQQLEPLEKEKAKLIADINKGIDFRFAVNDASYESLIKENSELTKAIHCIKTKGVEKVMEENGLAPKKVEMAKDDAHVVKNVQIHAAGVKVPDVPNAPAGEKKAPDHQAAPKKPGGPGM
ncbi:MAG: hypothetical protein IKO32_08930 [Lachnospiraceae bacterium]|nr:hypothetical protein [Lachnospiraceae bacterium]